MVSSSQKRYPILYSLLHRFSERRKLAWKSGGSCLVEYRVEWKENPSKRKKTLLLILLCNNKAKCVYYNNKTPKKPLYLQRRDAVVKYQFQQRKRESRLQCHAPLINSQKTDSTVVLLPHRMLCLSQQIIWRSTGWFTRCMQRINEHTTTVSKYERLLLVNLISSFSFLDFNYLLSIRNA